MKNLLLILIGFTVLVVLFADGGLNISPTLSPSVSPRFDFAPNITYAPQTTTTNIEHQTVIVQSGGATQGSSGVTTVDPSYRLCQPLPGETIIHGPDGHSACFVQDSSGNRFFLNAAGSRWPLASTPGNGSAPLQPQAADLTLDQLQAAFLRNGGSLPLLWGFKGDQGKIDWLKRQPEVWR